MAKTGFVQREIAPVRPFVPDASQAQVLSLQADQSAVVLGAPGSGKTALLTELVAARVAAGTNPDNIVVLSPNRVAASRLRNTLGLRLGTATNGALARTPGSLAFALAQEHALTTGQTAPRMLTGSEQDSIISELLLGHIEDGTGPAWPDPLVPEVRQRRAFRSELRDLFARSTEMGWTPVDLRSEGETREHPEWVAASQFWSEYREVIAGFRTESFDSSEILAIGANALADSAVMPNVELVLVDDAQELTYGAVRILQAFARRGVPVVVFGDPDITSTTFRGAVPNFLGRFAVELGISTDLVKSFVLDSVYRHGAQIRSAVSKMTEMGSAEAGAQRKALSVVEDAVSSPVQVLERSSRVAETTAIARQLREHHILGSTAWSQMAVVVRTSSLVPQVARALAVAEVPTRTLLSERSLKEHPAALDLIAAIAVAMGRMELTPNVATDLLTSPMVGLTVLDLRRLRLALRHDELAAGGVRTGEELLIAALEQPADLVTLDFAPARRAARFAETLQMLRSEIAAGNSIEELLWTTWERSGLAKTWGTEALSAGLIADDANRNLDGVMALFTSARRYVERYPDRPAAEYIAELLEADVPEDTLAPQAQADAVLVCTPSALIGTEFDVVAIAAVQENLWPNLRPRGSLLHAQDLLGDSVGVEIDFAASRKEVLDDELRMFALALSRAKQSVILTATANDDTLPSPFLRRVESVLGVDPEEAQNSERNGLSEYPLTLRGLVGSLRRALTLSLRRGESSDRSAQLATALAKLSAEEIPGAAPTDWYGLREPSTSAPLVDLSVEGNSVSVSPSKLDTWEKNQLAWFIESVVGRTSSSAQGIGTIVHKVMEDASAEGQPIDADSLWAAVDERWHELSFDAEWLSTGEKRRVRKMVAAVSEYLQNFKNDGKTLLATEGGFTLELGNATLRGYIDRIEQDAVGQVVIVDLKTGKYEPRVKDLPEHAQLACYQLALTEGALKEVPEGARNGGAKLIYVTNGTRGKLYKAMEQKPYDDTELQTIRERIENAAEGMAGNEFTAPIVIEEERGKPHTRYEFRIHTSPAVSAS
ncbi:superfamily I DNA/RNA helicase/RecB family exonuclease [Aurantimicrobium minutum]|uniref:UrvD/REP family ATP-dependent DNA helicase n=1 Tax=Aurantimicrobium minutum TaxID=708131 RepID=UPI0024074733|nr:UrvD/REP family ATP-dependent DNA helicase [Aurantimicrobium minutum]MDF9809152.1 superfamily I DNA/RNA helicase/RecB family exonuclease [Aurantimicrobium minutum]